MNIKNQVEFEEMKKKLIYVIRKCLFEKNNREFKS